MKIDATVRMLGIDPGLRGAGFLIAPEGVQWFRMPTYSEQRSRGKTKNFIDEYALVEIVRDLQPTHVTIEDVYAGAYGLDKDGNKREQGVVSAFTFGEGKGILKGVFAAMDIRPVWVRPQDWKGAMKVTADKQTSKAMAARMFPTATIKSADIAEAGLIAVYGLLKIGKLSPG